LDATGDRCVLGEQPDERETGDRLPAARLADDPEDLAALELERELVHGVHGTVLGLEADREVGHGEERHGTIPQTARPKASMVNEPSGSSSRQRSRTCSRLAGSSRLAYPAEVPTPSVATAHHSSKSS